MTAYLLDSNHAGTLVTPEHLTRRRIIERMKAGDVFHITLLAITETVFGFSILPRAAKNRFAWDEVRPALQAIGMDEADALNAARMQVDLRRQGWQLGTVDALIAVTALRYDLTLLTTDGDFRRVPSLKIDNWRAIQP